MSDENKLTKEEEERIEGELQRLFAIGEAVAGAITSTIHDEIGDEPEARLKSWELLYILGTAMVDIASEWATVLEYREKGANAKPNDPH